MVITIFDPSIKTLPTVPCRKRSQMPGLCPGGILNLRYDWYIKFESVSASGSIFQVRGHSFSPHGPPNRKITYMYWNKRKYDGQTITKVAGLRNNYK